MTRSNANRYMILLFPVLLPAGACARGGAASGPEDATADPALALARRVLAEVPLVDGHNDLPWEIRQQEAAPGDVVAYDLRRRTPGHTDIARLREGMVGIQFWSIYIPFQSVEVGAARTQLEQIDIAKQIFARYPDVFVETLTVEEAMAAWRSGRIA